MSFAIGIIGLPNVGKSTLFTALTKKQVDSSNYPFCTIDPNVGIVKVPDERLNKLAKVLKPNKVLPTTIEFVDIAGLVKNAHLGEGLGNQFLSHVREVDAIAHVVRTFKDSSVTHVPGNIDPEEDIKTIRLELIMADLATIQKRIANVEQKARTGEKEAKELLPILKKLEEALDKGQPAREVQLIEEELSLIKELHLLTIKPELILKNVSEEELGKTKESSDDEVIISAKIESELAELSDQEAQEYLEESGIKETGLTKFIQKSYELLDLITFFTTENNIVQAWTVEREASAPEAATKIHTDFQKGFIMAHVIFWEELVKAGSFSEAKEKGLVQEQGKDYKVQDGDVIKFAFSK